MATTDNDEDTGRELPLPTGPTPVGVPDTTGAMETTSESPPTPPALSDEALLGAVTQMADASREESELHDRINEAVHFQESEIARNDALLEQVRERIARYDSLVIEIEKLKANAQLHEKDLLDCIAAAQFARSHLAAAIRK